MAFAITMSARKLPMLIAYIPMRAWWQLSARYGEPFKIPIFVKNAVASRK